MGAAQDLDKPDLAAVTAGLWDNRSNYDASGNVYPSTGGSGTSGAVLKSDQWRISVAGTLGGTAVSVGDVLVALVDTPGSTSSNWMVLQGNVVAFTGDSGSGGLEGLVPAPAAGDSAAGKFLKANGQWVAVSTSNLGSANLTSADNARTFTLKSGGTASQNLQFLNSGGGNLLTLYGNKNIEFGSSSNTLTEFLINLSGTAGTFRMASGSTAYAIYYDAPAFNFSIRSATSYKVDIFGGLGSIYTTGDTSSGYYLNKIGGTPAAALYNNNGSNLYMNNSSGTRLINIETVNGFGHVVGGWAVGLAYSIVPTARLQVKGSGSTSATTTALFENSSSVACLTIKDDLTSTFGGIITTPQVITTPATITVAANAGTVTRANRINKFTNSSAAAMTITMSTTAALDGDLAQVRIYDFSAATQTITWVNTENSSVTVPATSNGSTTLPLTVGFQYNSATSKWRCIGSV